MKKMEKSKISAAAIVVYYASTLAAQEIIFFVSNDSPTLAPGSRVKTFPFSYLVKKMTAFSPS